MPLNTFKISKDKFALKASPPWDWSFVVFWCTEIRTIIGGDRISLAPDWMHCELAGFCPDTSQSVHSRKLPKSQAASRPPVPLLRCSQPWPQNRKPNHPAKIPSTSFCHGDEGSVTKPAAGHRTMEPRRAIFSEFQLRLFQRSAAHQALVDLVTEGAKAGRPSVLNDRRKDPASNSILFTTKVRGVRASSIAELGISPVVQHLAALFTDFDRWIDEIPPLQQPMRFGNRAFCEWHRRLQAEGTRKVSSALVQGMHEAGADAEAERFRLREEGGEGLVEEASAYLLQCFGHHVRIDYGTGHETSFVMWWLSLRRAGAITENDTAAMVLEVFAKGYLGVVRRLQVRPGGLRLAAAAC
eukprot:scaffold47_cov258-Pinguiococcus_pyrenoidosus.AAC.65